MGAPDAASAATRARAEALLRLGEAAMDAFGGSLGEHAARAMQWLDDIGRDSGGMLEINRRLLPVLQSFQRRRRIPKLWRWWIGEQLEEELALPQLLAEVEAMVGDGRAYQNALDARVAQLRGEDQQLGELLASLDREIAACRLLLGQEFALARQSSGQDAAHWQRLERRCGNLEAMAASTQLSRAQFQLAAQHAQSVSDRFVEIHRLLLPLWNQTIGFELFSRRTATTKE